MNNQGRTAGLPTLEDVARQAGVSTATVSRCLNNPGQVTETTRARVMEAVEKLRYTPNFGARALAARRTNTYGAVIPTMENAIFARGVQAFQDALASIDSTLLVASSNYEASVEESQIRNLVARGADGLLLIGADRDPAIYDFLAERGIPVVLAWAIGNQPGVSFVGFDNEAASRKLAEKALSLGHRRIAYISAQSTHNDRARARIDGVRAAMKAAGLDPRSLRLVETHYSIKRGKAAFHVLMETGERPSLVMCGNDVLAVGAVMAAREMGIDVPGDVSITGFDDIEIATVVSPPITTVHVPHRKMGNLAAQALLRQTLEGRPPETICLETEIAERASLGPAG